MAKTVSLQLRKPPQDNTADVDAFVNAGGEKPSLVPAKADAKPKGKVQRADGTEARRLVVYLPPDVMQRLRMHCAEHEVSLSSAVTEALAGNLG